MEGPESPGGASSNRAPCTDADEPAPPRRPLASTHAAHGSTFPPFTPRGSRRAKAIARNLRKGQPVDDVTFDEVFPAAVAQVSGFHWTPVDIAVRAARLLAPTPAQTVLDVGAGAGKFCLVAAAVSGACVRGVERNPYLARVARESARRMGMVIDVREGVFDDEDPSAYDGIFAFNPFVDPLFVAGVIDARDHDAARATDDVARMVHFLRRARTGARLVTLCGFGAAVPREYELRCREQYPVGILEFWEKTAGQ